MLHLVAKEGGEADRQTERRQREGDTEMEKDHTRPRDALMQRQEKTQRHRERKEETAHSQRKHHQITLLGRQAASSVTGQDRGPGTGHSEPLPQGTQQLSEGLGRDPMPSLPDYEACTLSPCVPI